MGFDARWGVLGAADVGANHQRDRIWIVAKQRNILSHALHNGFGWGQQQQKSTQKTSFANTRCQSERPDKGLQPTSQISIGENASIVCGKVSDTPIQRCKERSSSAQDKKPTSYVGWHDSHRQSRIDWWAIEPDVGRVAHGVAARNDRLKAIGNGQVPLCAATAWRILSESL